MQVNVFKTKFRRKKIVLALGPESSGNFSVFKQGKVFFCRTNLDLFKEKSFFQFKNLVSQFLRKEKIKPNVILTDLHPFYATTVWGEELARKYKVRKLEIQHHLAHIFSSLGDKMIKDSQFNLPSYFIGVACDGTGYGWDGKIWGGEIIEVQSIGSKVRNIRRIGHLENQIMIGGDWSVREPTRMLISILSRFLDKEEVFKIVKKYYSRNQFETLYHQLQAKFNCQETSSTARVLDAVSVLLGFSQNKRKEKHEPVLRLEGNSTNPYKLNPCLAFDYSQKCHLLLTTPLLRYLIKNIKRNRKRLAATAQIYLARGLYSILKKNENGRFLNKQIKSKIQTCFFSGGMANNRFMADYFSSKGFYLSQKVPRGDEGLSLGQLFYYLLRF